MQHQGSHLMSLAPIALIVLIAMSIAYWVGTKNVGIPFLSTDKFADVTDKNEKIKLLEKLNNKLEHDVALVQRSAKVELAAVEEMKKTLREKDLELLKLNQELHFYRTLYSPNTDNSGIQVKVFNLHKDQITKRFVYDLVLTSVPKKKEKTSGVIGLSVDGEQQGILKRLVFEDISEITDTSLMFSFKYFQKISGSFSLPDDFEPSSVRVEVLRDNSKKEPIVISYNWKEVYKGS